MELADIRRLKRLGLRPCGFEPRRPHFSAGLIHINARAGHGRTRSNIVAVSVSQLPISLWTGSGAMHFTEIDGSIEADSGEEAFFAVDPRPMTSA